MAINGGLHYGEEMGREKGEVVAVSGAGVVSIMGRKWPSIVLFSFFFSIKNKINIFLNISKKIIIIILNLCTLKYLFLDPCFYIN
jgi:hypothetical protein